MQTALRISLITLIIIIVFGIEKSCAQKLNLDLCQVYGKIYVTTNKSSTDFKVYLEESESYGNIIVYQQKNKLFADKSGQWYYTTNKAEADYWIYFEEAKGLSDFSISYTETESFAGCKQ